MANRSKNTNDSQAAKEVQPMPMSVIIDKINSSVDSVSTDGLSGATSQRSKSTIPLDEEIPCRSIKHGGLIWKSPKSNAVYRWRNMGSVEYIPYSDIVTLNNTKREYLSKPYIVILDERAVEYFKLRDVYEKVSQIHDLESAFKKGVAEVANIIDSAIKVNMRDVLISKVRDMRQSGILTNIDIIQLLERKLGIDMSEYANGE